MMQHLGRALVHCAESHQGRDVLTLIWTWVCHSQGRAGSIPSTQMRQPHQKFRQFFPSTGATVF